MKNTWLCVLLTTSVAIPAAQATDAVKPTPHRNLSARNSNAPINVSSDTFEGNLQTKVGTYIGNVVVTQADDRLRADKVKVDVVAGKPSRFDATGHVVFVSPSGTATGDNGVYELGPRTITLTGHVVLTKDKDVMRGTSLVVDMDTGQSRLIAQGAQGNRVQGLFVQQPQSGTAKSKSAGSGKQ
ncbi:MAG TPA: LptA/OstA family protein [Rhizomicrobium sp.]|jgi:lipopolysaccharide export system protein LptA|nr:LptA/OstA family protein [Rhizomicrobium sp.]